MIPCTLPSLLCPTVRLIVSLGGIGATTGGSKGRLPQGDSANHRLTTGDSLAAFASQSDGSQPMPYRPSPVCVGSCCRARPPLAARITSWLWSLFVLSSPSSSDLNSLSALLAITNCAVSAALLGVLYSLALSAAIQSGQYSARISLRAGQEKSRCLTVSALLLPCCSY
jgi:hypothetical protein